ncbi:rRNA-processing protein bfr2 [Ceratobasidium sp. UAMH 11750]|nr:rRNA-processing protein bfr2 [Ceratobasidium sp. UAMH 11750]
MSGLTLAEQIARLDDAAPADVDIERLDGGLAEDGEDEGDLSAGRGHYLDVGTSSLRKQQAALVDPKYDGTRTSRSQLYEFDGGSDDEELDGQGSASGSESGEDAEEEEEDEEPLEEEEHTLSSEQDGTAEDDEPAPTHEPAEAQLEDNLAETLKKTREADKDKGRAIIRQRALWDSLVETRIRMQKGATANNRLPHPDHLAPYVTSEAGRGAAQALLQEVLALSEDLFTLRKRLLKINEPEVQPPLPKRRKLDTEDDWEEQTRDATISVAELDAVYHPHCVCTLQKWSSKIAAVTPTLSSRSKSFRGGGAPRSAVELVEDALGESGANGGGKAVGRTRVRRSGGARIGTAVDGEEGVDGVEGDAEVFDDLDFYQTLLRDVIDSRTGADGAEDWTTRQRLKKAKKVVDTKASKGRKLRYEVHEKLQNFMVPVPTGTWHEEQIDELFANLLGRGITGTIGR